MEKPLLVFFWCISTITLLFAVPPRQQPPETAWEPQPAPIQPRVSPSLQIVIPMSNPSKSNTSTTPPPTYEEAVDLLPKNINKNQYAQQPSYNPNY